MGLVFAGHTAWFSTSVHRHRVDLWLRHGGELSDVDTAKFVFSDNPQAEDTLRVFESEDYSSDFVAVFHSAYVEKCVHCGDMEQVVLGEYFLPEKDVYEQIKGECHFKWEHSGDTQRSTHSPALPSIKRLCRSRGVGVGRCSPSPPKSPAHQGYLPLSSLPGVSGDISDFRVGHNNCCVSRRM